MQRRLRFVGVLPVDVEDLCHEVFIVAHEKLPPACDGGAIALWLDQVCRYVALAHRRRAVNRLEITCADIEEDAPTPLPARENARTEELDLDSLYRVLSVMSERDLDLIALHEVGDLSFRVIGDLCGCDPKTAKKRFLAAERRARVLLREGGTRGAVRLDGAEAGLEPEPPVGDSAIEATPNLRLGTYEGALITSWRGPITARELDVVRACLRAHSGRVGGRVAHLAFVEPECPKPNLQDRHNIIEIMRSARLYVAFDAFVAAPRKRLIAQGVLLAMGALARVAFPIRVFNEAGPAADWLTSVWRKSGGLPFGRDDLLEAASSIRQRVTS